MDIGQLRSQQEEEIIRLVSAGAEELVELTRALVRIPSVTGSEGAVQEEVASRFRKAGLDADVWTPGEELLPYPRITAGQRDFSGRPNVVGTLKGSGGGRSLILNGHADVVTPGDEKLWSHDPWGADVESGRIYGRGSTDMKGGLAAAVLAVMAIRRAGVTLAGDVVLESVVSEENGGAGAMSAILRGYRADAAIVMEPTRLAVVPAHGGSSIFRLTVPGRAAHAAARNEGVSAVEKFCYLASELSALEAERNETLRHPLYTHLANKIPLNVGVVNAGLWPSMVPERLEALGRYGLLPGEDAEAAVRAFEERLSRACQSDPWLRGNPAKVEWYGAMFEPAETPVEEPVTQLLIDCCETALGRSPSVEGVTYGADMRLLIHHAGIPTVLFGPGDIRLAHFTDEYVEIEELVAAAKVLALATLRWCGEAR